MLIMKEGMGRVIYFEGKGRKRGNSRFQLPKTLEFYDFPCFVRHSGYDRFFKIERDERSFVIAYNESIDEAFIQRILNQYVDTQFDLLNFNRIPERVWK